MKSLALAVLCMIGFSTSAFAEKLLCVDKQHKSHHVEFIGDNIDFLFVDDVQYDYTAESKDGKTIQYSSDNHHVKFLVDPDNRDWFFLVQTTKGKNEVEKFYALCDNVHVLEEEQKTKLILNK